MASRHQARSLAVQALYQWDFYGSEKGKECLYAEKVLAGARELKVEEATKEFFWRLFKGTVAFMPEIDRMITEIAPKWPIDKMTLVDRNILRLGLYELLHLDQKEVPPKVAIHEAIELGKDFGGVASGHFINGILGAIYEDIKKKEKNGRDGN